MSETRKRESDPSERKERRYACFQCGYSVTTIAETHRITPQGDLVHWCPDCEEDTNQGADWDHRRAPHYRDLTNKYDARPLHGTKGFRADCTICNPQRNIKKYKIRNSQKPSSER